tara:strand:- start:1072 stop:1710 length:639 start_codon:yes stop_codon:yes gene_type:complete
MTILMKELQAQMREKGLTQQWLSEKLNTHTTHLNKIFKGKASLTKTMAKKISDLKEIDISEQELMYPNQPLNIVGQYYTDYSVEIFEIDRPQIKLPGQILPTQFGILDRGNKNKSAIFYTPIDDAMIEIYDSTFQRDKKIDERALGNSALICTEKNEWISCRLGQLNRETKEYQYWTHYSSLIRYAKLKWASILIAKVNLKAMKSEFDVEFE